jgi:hypothetical protein
VSKYKIGDPIPAKSKAQFRYMQALAHGDIKNNSGMTRAKAQEYVSHNQGPMAYHNLPDRTPKLRKMMRGGKV